MLLWYLFYVCMHIGNWCKIAGSTYSVLVCYRNSWFHLMFPNSSLRGRETNHSLFTFSCQSLFYIALSLLLPVTSFQSWRILVCLISPSTETIPCLCLCCPSLYLHRFFSISFWDTVTCNAVFKMWSNLGLIQWHSAAFPAALGCFNTLHSIYLFRLPQGNEQMFLLSNLQRLYDLFAEC